MQKLTIADIARQTRIPAAKIRFAAKWCGLGIPLVCQNNGRIYSEQDVDVVQEWFADAENHRSVFGYTAGWRGHGCEVAG